MDMHWQGTDTPYTPHGAVRPEILYSFHVHRARAVYEHSLFFSGDKNCIVTASIAHELSIHNFKSFWIRKSQTIAKKKKVTS